MFLQRTHRPFWALFLALIFSTSTVLKLAHVLLDEHHHEERHFCELDPKSNDRHFHDASYVSNDCDLCAFVLSSPAVLPEVFGFEWVNLAPVVSELRFAEQSHCLAFAGSARLLRGPPAC